MTDLQGERDPAMDDAERRESPQERHWPDEEEPALPRTEEGTIPAVVGGTSPSGQIPVAAGLVRTPDAPAEAAEGEETGGPDEWRVPREEIFPPDDDKG